MTAEPAFVGAKTALIAEGRVLTHLRDDLPGLPFANCWDFPGGGREGQESAADCALRELHEEYGMVLPQERLIWRRATDLPPFSGPLVNRVCSFLCAIILRREQWAQAWSHQVS